MHTGRNYNLKEYLIWTRREIYLCIVLASFPTTLYQVFHITWIAIPWAAVALVGTAAAFIVGFKNTQTYNRLWEARKIWGAIVNGSRTWGIMTKDFIKTDSIIHQQLIYRHFAWLTALRYQLRKPQSWENQNKAYNEEYRTNYSVPEWEGSVEEELKNYLSDEELLYILSKKNRAAQIICLQSKQLRQLKAQNKIDPFEYVELEKRLADLYDQQGKCERIKNFPYPRQFSTITLFFVWLLVIILPLGLVTEFNKLGEHMVWLNIPFSIIISWIFISMDKTGESTENPFEGGPDDIPITAMSRGIEIDLRDMLDEAVLPQPITPVNNILM